MVQIHLVLMKDVMKSVDWSEREGYRLGRDLWLGMIQPVHRPQTEVTYGNLPFVVLFLEDSTHQACCSFLGLVWQPPRKHTITFLSIAFTLLHKTISNFNFKTDMFILKILIKEYSGEEVRS
jgi:hypothetical protein